MDNSPFAQPLAVNPAEQQVVELEPSPTLGDPLEERSTITSLTGTPSKRSRVDSDIEYACEGSYLEKTFTDDQSDFTFATRVPTEEFDTSLPHDFQFNPPTPSAGGKDEKIKTRARKRATRER